MGSMNSTNRSSGAGAGYCYVGTARFLHVAADSLWLARLCCCPKLRLVKTLTYKPNSGRSHFVFAR